MSIAHVKKANDDQDKWVPKGNERFGTDPNDDGLTRVLYSDEVRSLAALRWQQAQKKKDSKKDNKEEEVEEPIGSWLQVTFIDTAVYYIARHLHEVATGEAPTRPLPTGGDSSSSSSERSESMRCIITNTDSSTSSGQHWFTVAYDVCLRD